MWADKGIRFEFQLKQEIFPFSQDINQLWELFSLLASG
jgi:hypothetical protein